MTSLRFALVVSLCCCALACSKKPSVAQPALEGFIDSVAHVAPDTAFLTPEGSKYTPVDRGTDGPPTEGTFEVPMINVGRYEWTRYKLEKEEKVGADLLITVVGSICMRPDEPDNATCNRPNDYRFRALMRNEGSGWKVAGLSTMMINQVR